MKIPGIKLWQILAKHTGLCLALLLAGLVFVLHRSQECTPIGPAFTTDAPRTTPEGRWLSQPFAVEKGQNYLVVIQGQITGQVALEMQAADAKPLSTPKRIYPLKGHPDAPYHKMLRAKASSPAAVVSLQPAPGEQIRKITLQRLDPAANMRRNLAIGSFLLAAALAFLGHRRSHRAQALALGLGYFLCLLPWELPGNFAVSCDGAYYVPTNLSLLHEGNLQLDEYGGANPDVTYAGDYRIAKAPNGHYYNQYPVGTSLVIHPLVVVGNWLHDQVPAPLDRARLIAHLVAKLLSAGTVALVFLMLGMLGQRWGLALLGALVFGFTTAHFSTHAGGLWSHTVTTFLSALALCLLLWKEGRHAAWVAVPLCLGFACRPTMLVPGLLLGWGVLMKSPRQFLGYLGISIVLGIGFVALSQSMWGTTFPPYYTDHLAVQQNGPIAFLGTLFSPSRGLLIYSPVLCFAILGGVVVWRQRRRFPLVLRLCTLIVILEWTLASRNHLWWGGHGYGPRMLTEAILFAIPLLLPAWNFVASRSSGLRTGLTVLAILTCGWGLFVEGRGLIFIDVYEWNAHPNIDEHPERLWDWHDWQIFSHYDHSTAEPAFQSNP